MTRSSPALKSPFKVSRPTLNGAALMRAVPERDIRSAAAALAAAVRLESGPSFFWPRRTSATIVVIKQWLARRPSHLISFIMIVVSAASSAAPIPRD